MHKTGTHNKLQMCSVTANYKLTVSGSELLSAFWSLEENRLKKWLHHKPNQIWQKAFRIRITFLWLRFTLKGQCGKFKVIVWMVVAWKQHLHKEQVAGSGSGLRVCRGSGDEWMNVVSNFTSLPWEPTLLTSLNNTECWPPSQSISNLW